MCRPERDSNLNIIWVFLHSCKFSATTFWLNSLWKSIPKSGFSSLLCKWCQLHLSVVQIQVHMVKQFDPLEIKSELISRREWAHLYSYFVSLSIWGELPENVFSIPSMCLSSVVSPYPTSCAREVKHRPLYLGDFCKDALQESSA